jgi:hypothetical protein
MPAIIACKLPHGLQIDHNGRKIVLRGANVGEDLENVSKNGRPADNAGRVNGYGLTTLNDADLEAYQNWAALVTFRDGKKENGKLAEPFAPLENGSILGPFKSEADARKETADLSSAVQTGFEGVDPTDKKHGIEKADGKD